MSQMTAKEKTVQWLIQYRLMGVVIFAGFLSLATVVVVTGPQAEPQGRTEKAWPVSVVTVEPRSLAPTLIAYGKVESRQVANLKTSITAPVSEVLAWEGEWVEQGDLLITLDRSELELAVNMAMSEYRRRKAQLESARTDYKLAKNLTAHHRELKEIAEAKLARFRNLYDKKLVADSVLDEARRQASERSIVLEKHLASVADFPNRIEEQQAAVNESRAKLERARLDLAQTEVRAPFQGRVIETFVAPGDRVLPGNPLIRVADYDGLEVRASIPSKTGDELRRRIRDGETVRAQGMVDGRPVELLLDRLSANVKSGQSGLDVFFKTASNDALDIGRVVTLEISMPPEERVVALPVQSIYGNDRIYRVEDQRLVALEVEQVGDYLDDAGEFKVLVRSADIESGDRIVTTQLPRAISGLLVDPMNVNNFDKALASKPELPDRG